MKRTMADVRATLIRRRLLGSTLIAEFKDGTRATWLWADAPEPLKRLALEREAARKGPRLS